MHSKFLCVENLLRNYEAILLYFKSYGTDGKTNKEVLKETMHDPRFLLMLAFHYDVLSILKHISLLFQSQVFTLMDFGLSIHYRNVEIQGLLYGDGDKLKEIRARILLEYDRIIFQPDPTKVASVYTLYGDPFTW